MIFSTWEWQSAWWTAYAEGDLWVVACRDDDDRLIALAPWFVQHKPDGRRVVRSIGCVDVTDYVDVIVAKGYSEVVFNALAHHLLENSDRYDCINLCNIPESSVTTKVFSDALRGCGFEVDIELQEVCPVIYLPESWDDYLANLGKKQRHEIRRKIRRAEGEAKIEWYIVGSEHDLHEEMERFITLMAASHPEKAEFLQDEHNVRFFKELLPLAFERGWLQLNFLTINGEDSAAYFNFEYDNRILVYNSGLMPSDSYGHLSPGIVLLAYNIRHAIEAERKVFDFLRGNETYKYRMGGEDTRVFKLQAHLN
jgi:CelD/BcsL family acetyltransferase involved in cellulose biosynthesis